MNSQNQFFLNYFGFAYLLSPVPVTIASRRCRQRKWSEGGTSRKWGGGQ